MTRLFFPLTLLLSLSIVPWCPAESPSTQPTTAPADQPATVKVVRGSLPIRVDGEGVLEPAESFEIRIKPKAYTGELTLKSIAKPGTLVKAGDVLLELDDKPIRKEISSAENELETARANYDKAMADTTLIQQADEIAMKQAANELENATAALKWFDEIDGPQMLQMADLGVKQAKFSLEDQNDELDQLRKMYKTEELTSATADIVIKRALRQVELSKVAVTREENEARKVKEHAHPEQRQQLALALEQKKNSVEQLKVAHAQGAVQRKVALAIARQAMEDVEKKLTELKDDALQFKQSAAVEGTIYYGQFTNRAWTGNEVKTFTTGEKLTAGNVAMTLIVPGKLRVAMDLPEAHFTSVKAGLDASVVPIVLGQKLVGKTLAPSPIAKSGGLELQIELSPVSDLLTPGMKAKVVIEAGNADNVLLVPDSAIADSKVWVIGGDGTPHLKHVLAGRTGNEQTEILDGLNDGDDVLKDAQK